MKNAYIGLALAACLSIASTSLWAKVAPASEHPGNISASATFPTEHQEAAALHKKYLEHHKPVAAEYEKAGHHELKNTTKRWPIIMRHWQKNMKKQRPLMKKWQNPSNTIITCYYYQDGHSSSLNFS